MRRRVTEHALFFREFCEISTPRGPFCPAADTWPAALTRFVGEKSPPRREILEVGPGTGAVTRRIIAGMGSADCLDLVELNRTFVEQLERRFRTEPAFRAVADGSRVLHCPVEDLPRSERYHLIVSGLPLNNFAVAEVEQILAALNGTIGARRHALLFRVYCRAAAARLVSGRAERERLRGIGKALAGCSRAAKSAATRCG